MKRYREKGSIGYIGPPRCTETTLEEAFRIRPPGLTWCFASLGLPELTERDFDTALAMIETATRELALRKVNVITFGGMPLQTLRGPEYHRELTARMQAAAGDAIPTETGAGLVLKALHALGARRVSLITPYQRSFLNNLARTVEADGFDVVSAKGIELKLAEIITELDFDSAYQLAIESFQEQPDTDAFYLSCPQWPVVGNIERLERETGKPVVGMMTAILWWALAMIGLEDRVAGYGRLLAERPAIPNGGGVQ